jgi:hypothetical protein
MLARRDDAFFLTVHDVTKQSADDYVRMRLGQIQRETVKKEVATLRGCTAAPWPIAVGSNWIQIGKEWGPASLFGSAKERT